MAALCSPKHGPGLFTVLKILFVWMFCSHVKTFKFMAGPRSPTSSVTAQLSFRRWRLVSFWCCANTQQRSNERLVVLPQTRSRVFHGVEEPFPLDGMKLFKNIRTYGWAVLPQTRPSAFHGVDGNYFNGYSAAMQKHSSLWLGRAPQHPLSRPSSFRGVEDSFRFDVMQTFNNVQTNGWSCSPKHGPAHFTVLKNFFIWMVRNLSKTFELMAGPCSPKHGPDLFTELKILFALMFGSHVKTFKLMAWPRSPTSSVTAQLISRRWRIVSFWWCSDFQHCSNERMVVLPQTRSRSFHGVDDFFYRDGMKFFKNIRTCGWVVLPQTRPSSVHGVEKPFRLNIKRSSLWLGRAPQHPLSRPSLFRGVEESFRFDVMQTLNNVQTKGFSKTLELMVGPCSPKHGPVLFTVLKNVFVWMLCSHVKTFKFMAGPCFPTSPFTAQLFSRRWRLVSFWCCANFQQRLNERLVVLPQTRPSSFLGVDDFFYLDGMKLFKNNRTDGWVVLPQTRPSSFHGVEERFRLDVKHSKLWLGRAPQHPLSRPSSFRSVEESLRFGVVQTFNNVQMNGWSCSPKHSPVHFTVLKKYLIWMAWSFSKTVELMAGPCSPKHGPVPFTVLKNLFAWKLCSHVKTFKLIAGPRSPTSPVTAQLNSRCWRIISFWC